MIATFYPDALTPFSFEEAAKGMRAALDAYQDVGAGRVRDDVLALALAKTALETGRWRSIHCNNWGNIKCGEETPGGFTCYRCNEVIGGKVEWFEPGTGGYSVPPGHPQTRFRAYPNLWAGAYAYVDFVSTGRYAEAWRRLHTGDSDALVHALKVAGYFTADEREYAKGVASMQREFVQRLKGVPREQADPVDLDWERLKASILGRPVTQGDCPCKELEAS